MEGEVSKGGSCRPPTINSCTFSKRSLGCGSKGNLQAARGNFSHFLVRFHTNGFRQVSDSQCPGVIVEGESDYAIDWVPRPSIALSPDTKVTYDGYNGSFIRAPVCEGSDDFVDLDVTGWLVILYRRMLRDYSRSTKVAPLFRSSTTWPAKARPAERASLTNRLSAAYSPELGYSSSHRRRAGSSTKSSRSATPTIHSPKTRSTSFQGMTVYYLNSLLLLAHPHNSRKAQDCPTACGMRSSPPTHSRMTMSYSWKGSLPSPWTSLSKAWQRVTFIAKR